MKRYKIDFANKTITITSAFAKRAAENTESEEYKLLKELQTDFPAFSVCAKTHKTPTKYKNKNGDPQHRAYCDKSAPYGRQRL